MSYRCQVCGSNEVDNQGDICELCAIGQDPYAASISNNNQSAMQKASIATETNSYTPKRNSSRKVLLNGGASVSNCDPYGNDMTPSQTTTPVKVYSAGQVPQSPNSNTNISSSVNNNTVLTSGNQPISVGITKNIMINNQKKSILSKWFRALFKGIPFTLDDDVTMFQVFPDFTGTSRNALGNACDQVIVYGKLNNGTVSENNDVEVFGHRDANNNIIAKSIRNKASGTMIMPMRTISTGVVWIITIFICLLVLATVTALGPTGIVWTIVIILCLTNLPLVIKIIGAIFGAIFSFLKRLF